MSKPRNPRYFPRMKVRGARRRRLASWQRMEGGFDNMATAFRLSAYPMNEAAEALRRAFATKGNN